MSKIKSTTHIFYHNDIDGIFTAAAFLHENFHDSKNNYCIHPVRSTLRGDKFNSLILETNMKKSDNDKVVILDFEYSEDCHYWVDHHHNKEFGDNPHFDNYVLYNPKAKSAFDILVSSLSCNFSTCEKAGYEDAVKHVNMIDNCEYPSIKYLFEDTNPYITLMRYLEIQFPSDMLYNRIVELIFNKCFDLDSVIETLGANPIEIRDINIEKAFEIKKHIVKNGNLAVSYCKSTGLYPRYSEYYIDDSIKYYVRFNKVSSNKYNVQLSSNTFDFKNDINICNTFRLMSEKGILLPGAGGHFNVGGGMIMADKCDEFIDYINPILNKGE